MLKCACFQSTITLLFAKNTNLPNIFILTKYSKIVAYYENTSVLNAVHLH